MPLPYPSKPTPPGTAPLLRASRSPGFRHTLSVSAVPSQEVQSNKKALAPRSKVYQRVSEQKARINKNGDESSSPFIANCSCWKFSTFPYTIHTHLVKLPTHPPPLREEREKEEDPGEETRVLLCTMQCTATKYPDSSCTNTSKRRKRNEQGQMESESDCHTHTHTSLARNFQRKKTKREKKGIFFGMGEKKNS